MSVMPSIPPSIGDASDLARTAGYHTKASLAFELQGELDLPPGDVAGKPTP